MDDQNDDYNQFLQRHQYQLTFNNIPKHFYRRLYEKMKNEIFDSGSYFQLCPVDDDDEELEKTYNPERRFYVSTLEDVILDPENDENAIFLIDHAWTYRINDARNDLKSIPKLYERMASLMNINCDTKEDGIVLILQRMWKFNQTYTLSSIKMGLNMDYESAQEPYWYVRMNKFSRLFNQLKENQTSEIPLIVDSPFSMRIPSCPKPAVSCGNSYHTRIIIKYIMDEFGSSIRHSSTYANVRCVSFFFEPSQTMFTLLFPIVRIEQPYAEIFRNYICNKNNELDQNIKLLPWQRVNHRKTILRSLKIQDCPELFTRNLQDEKEIFENYTKNILYDESFEKIQLKQYDEDYVWNVYTDVDQIKENLTDQHYKFVDNIDQADIIFTKNTIEDFRYQTLQNKLINQFPFENVLTNKQLFALTARRWRSIYGSSFSFEVDEIDPYVYSHGSPPWLPTTFDLTYELTQFAIYFQYCEDHHNDNIWIVKPIKLARSLDISITNLFDMTIRLPESGRKIVSKYVSNPVLLKFPDTEANGIKFDIRYLLLLNSVRPLKLYIHKIFWPRFANKPFSIKELDDHETHLTAINDRSNMHSREIDCETFINMFNEQYARKWSTIEQNIFEIFREIFHCATLKEPPLSIGSCLSSRALYAADVTLELNNDTIQPKLLDINYFPDCHRASNLYPDFYNQAFNTLFRNIVDEQYILDISA